MPNPPQGTGVMVRRSAQEERQVLGSRYRHRATGSMRLQQARELVLMRRSNWSDGKVFASETKDESES